jgi:hypothetical protein
MIINGKILATADGATILHDGKAKVIGSIIGNVEVENGEEITTYNLVVLKLDDKTNFDLFVFDSYTGQLINYAIGRQTPIAFQKLIKKVIKSNGSLEKFVKDFTLEYVNFALSNA